MMSSIFFTSTVKFYNGAEWVDITSDVISDITCEYGIDGQSPADRVAGTGTLIFRLCNDDGRYTPYHESQLMGWGKGAEIAVYINGYYKFHGWIESIQVDTSAFRLQAVSVTVVDWIDHAAELVLSGIQALQNKRANEALLELVQRMPKQPLAHNLVDEVGDTVFNSVFDTLESTDRAYSEIVKLVNSELGYVYIRHRLPTPNALTFANAGHRNGLAELSKIPIDESLSECLLLENGSKLLQENGDEILVDDYEDAIFDNLMRRIEIRYGENLFNRVNLSVYPRRIDSTAKVLFSLDEPILLQPSPTPTTFSVTYNDPGGSNDRVTGTDMITPVANTDYKMHENSDGTGADLTSNLSVDVVYGINGATYSLRNTGTIPGYVTFLQARGYGIYTKNPLIAVAQSEASQIQHGVFDLSIDQRYLTSLDSPILNARSFLAQHKAPQIVIDSVEFVANHNGKLKQAFLWLDVGDLISIKETRSGTDSWFWIQSVRWSLRPGGIVTFQYGLKEHISLDAGSLALVTLKPKDAKYPTAPISYVNYSSVHYLQNLPVRTITGWLKCPEEYAGSYGMWFGLTAAYRGVFLSFNDVAGMNALIVAVDGFFESGRASWQSDEIPMASNKWYFVAVETNWGIVASSSPKIFIDGVEKNVTYTTPPQSGSYRSESGLPLVLANALWGTNLEFANQYGGELKDIRVYNRLLSQAEVAKLYADGAGAPTIKTGLLFQGPCIRTRESSKYIGATITEEEKLYDNVRLIAGDPVRPWNIIIGND